MENILLIIQNFDIAIQYVQDTNPVLIFIFYILFSASIGSFLGCCFYRVPRGISLINPKTSFCPHCSAKLTALDLFPILSYMILRGKCRHCGFKIAPIYFIIEVITVLLFLLIVYVLI